jgi:hypothetical protein
MAAKTIVTFHPDVECDVCGRRLLRGEQPDVFLSGGQRRTVCELCTPRATNEGWLRETQERAAGSHPGRPQRGRSLLGRLRQLREPARPVERRAGGGAERAESDPLRSAQQSQPGGELPLGDEWTGAGEQWAGADERWVETGAEQATPVTEGHDGERHPAGSSDEDSIGLDGSQSGGGRFDPALAPGAHTRPGAGVRRALEVFNAGEQPRRVAGVARALGAACVKAAPVTGAEDTIAIVVAWELCWYRYEIDLRDETAGVRLAAQGTELEELAEDDRVANVSADERGELSLLEI